MRIYKTLFLAILINSMAIGFAYSQDDQAAKNEELKSKIETLEENVSTLNTDVSALKKMKISGYFQFQYEKSEAAKGIQMNPYDSSDFVQNRFRVRRSRLKFMYDAGLTQFVVQGDFSNEKFELKDAYLNITDPWTKYFQLTTGVFNRPNYEIEYSSSQRESPERSAVVRALYPSERDLGMMMTATPEDWFKLQVAGYNNTIQGDLKQFYPNFRDESVYYMARLTKEFAFTDLGLGIDLGAHARFGNIVTNTKNVLTSDQGTKGAVDSTTNAKGSSLSKNWFGGEAQIYWDFLGGMKLMGEYITGTNVDEIPTAAAAKTGKIRMRSFSGFYGMLVKNITEDWQLAVKYDSYDPNTKIADDKIDDKADLTTNTLGFGLHNYTFDNVRITLWYDMIKTQTSETLKGYASDPIDNFLTLRFQYKF